MRSTRASPSDPRTGTANSSHASYEAERVLIAVDQHDDDEWPEEVAARVLVGDMKKPEVREAFRDAAEFAHEITQAFAKVVVVALP